MFIYKLSKGFFIFLILVSLTCYKSWLFWGYLEYHDFGGYITPKPSGRVRGSDTDNELHFPIQADIKNDKIENLIFLNLKQSSAYPNCFAKMTHLKISFGCVLAWCFDFLFLSKVKVIKLKYFLMTMRCLTAFGIIYKYLIFYIISNR